MSETSERLAVSETLAAECHERLDCLWAERRELKEVLKERAEMDAIIAAKEAEAAEAEAAEAENETLIEKDLTMEKKERTGTNNACRLNDAIPKIGEVVHRNLLDAITEREYLLHHKKPPHGWSSGITILIERRVTALNEMIADIIVEEERKTKNGK